jgi:hypothetical protein
MRKTREILPLVLAVATAEEVDAVRARVLDAAETLGKSRSSGAS